MRALNRATCSERLSTAIRSLIIEHLSRYARPAATLGVFVAAHLRAAEQFFDHERVFAFVPFQLGEHALPPCRFVLPQRFVQTAAVYVIEHHRRPLSPVTRCPLLESEQQRTITSCSRSANRISQVPFVSCQGAPSRYTRQARARH